MSAGKLRRLAAGRKISATRVAGQWRFRPEDLRQWLIGTEPVPGPTEAGEDLHRSLQDLEHDYSTLLDSISDGYGVICDGRLVIANKKGLADLGYAPHEALGKPFVELLAPEERAGAAEAYRLALIGAPPEQPYPAIMLKRDGSRLPVEGTFSATTYRGRPAIAILLRDVTRRLEAQQRLEASERFAFLLLDSINDFITVQDTEFNIIRVNRIAEAMFGQDLVGRKCYAAYRGRQDACPDCAVARALATGKPAFSVRRTAHNGIVAEISASPVRDSAGKVVAVIEQSRDVTARLQSEEALRRSEERYRRLFDDSPVALWEEDFSAVKGLVDALRLSGVTDLKGYLAAHPDVVVQCAGMVKVTDVNRAALEVYEAGSKQELMGGLGQVLGEESYVAFAKELEAVFEGRTVHEGEVINRTLKGSRKHLALHWSVASGYENTLARVIVAMVDVTDKREAAEAILRRNRELSLLNALASILNEIPQVAQALGVALGRVMDTLKMSLGLAYLVDKERGELVLQAARGLRAEFVEEMLRIKVGAGLIGAVPLSPGPVIVSDYASDPRLFCTTVVDAERLRTFAGFALKAGDQVVGAVCLACKEKRAFSAPELELLDTIGKQLGAAIDKERLLRAAAETDNLRALDTLKTQLLSVVSHEFRTPLASIKGYATLMLRYEGRIEVAERREYLTEIDRSTDRLTELIGHLLDMSRLDAGLLKLEKVKADVAALIDEAVAESRRRLPGRTFTTRIEDGLPRISVDRRRIRQVLDNILDNAVKYSTAGTEITIDARLHDGHVQVSVTDRGAGIARSDLERIFERMYRVERKTSSQVGGAGLGLTISRGLVEAHGGRIWAESQLGQGSTFHVILPA